MPRSVPVPNLGRRVKPPPTGSRWYRGLTLFSDANVWLYRRSGGRLGGRMGKAPVLLLHHVGRRSGRKRVTPVLFLADGPRLVVVASNGGAPAPPAWYRNLLADPRTTVEVGSRKVQVHAREATDGESASYWPRLHEMYPSFEIYKRRTDRPLPVIVLEPASSP